ncbi:MULTISPECIES: aldo/keto reductase [Rufibacter]|uniref:Aryl-alcohol dehydrogenase-like predicted oxidoreductase n=1 Tax=Rufibacter quisquiliarum TaxID=1549639 RepID=A0A839GYR7_9BACT|nr:MULTISPECIES: aldo/keto reductase [Rufibacter]MBA9079588.1 aryl-alcohol dehydrogenase-like predicted oxidoreductase [Rufibacter quisquiliarum]
MEKRKLGNSGLEVAPLAFGGNVFGWTADEKTSFQLLDGFLEAGFNLVDTADAYSVWVPGNKGGESESIIGKWMKERGNRDQVVVATKVGWEISPDRKGLRKDYIFKAVEDSLRRLQTDYLDLYQSHVDDASTPLEETLQAYDQLIKEGKVRAIGASNISAERLREALEVSRQNGLPRYQSLQPEYNLYNREGYEQELEALCLEQGVGVISYYSLASGFLTGKYRSEADLGKSPRGGGIKKFLNERGTRILSALDALAEKHQSTPAQISLAWLMARPSITAPIASATSLAQLDDLAKAAHLTLSPDDVEQLNQASAY